MTDREQTPPPPPVMVVMAGAPNGSTNNSTTSNTNPNPNTVAGPQLRQPAHKRSGALRTVGRSLAKGPRLLGRRIKHFLRDDLQLEVRYRAQPTHVTRELATLELLAVYHRWLRGVQAFMSILVLVMSFLSLPGSATVVNWMLFILSECTCMVIVKTYHVKAQFSGITNVLFDGRNVLTSPYFFHMLLELILWNLQTPPIVLFWHSFFDLFNYFVFLRLYSVVLYMNNALYVYRTFCRAMAGISDLPLSTSFLLRTSLVHGGRWVAGSVIAGLWFSIGCMYAKAEQTALKDGLWFSFQTLATLGYGDYTPTHVSGRAVAFIAWLGSTFLLAYLIVLAQGVYRAAYKDSANRDTLYRCHDLSHALRERSVRAIQTAWRLHTMQRIAGAKLLRRRLRILLQSWKLTFCLDGLRATRQALQAAQRSFHESDVHPLTGLSARQYSEHLYETYEAARHLQRRKDAERVYRALHECDLPAAALSRQDVMEMLVPTAADMDDLAGRSASSLFTALQFAPKAAAELRADSLVFGANGPAAGEAAAAGMSACAERMTALEEKCTRLAELLRSVAPATSVSPTAPPTASS